MKNDFHDELRADSIIRIPTKDGGPGEVTVEHIEGGFGGEDGGVRMALDFAPYLTGYKRGHYKAVYLTPQEARAIAIALLQFAQLPAYPDRPPEMAESDDGVAPLS